MKNTHKTAIIDQYKQNTIAVLYSNVDNVGGSDYGMPADYNSELEELHGILQAWDKPLKIEIVIGGNIGPFTKLMEMLENVRTTNNNLLFVVIMYMA